MKNIFRKISIFIKRDFTVNSSYRLSFFMDAVYILASMAALFFISRLFGQNTSKYLAEYGGNYFSFVIIGLAFNGFLNAGLTSFNRVISYEQSEGTLEILMLSPTKIPLIFLCATAGNFLLIVLKTAIYIILGRLVFGLDLSKANLILTAAVLIYAVIPFIALGILSTSFLLVFKRGDPVDWLFNGLSKLFGGVFFPVSVLPVYLQNISYILPTTYSLNALRKCVILGANIKEIAPEISCITIFIIIFLPLSIFSFNLALKKAKKNGSLLFS